MVRVLSRLSFFLLFFLAACGGKEATPSPQLQVLNTLSPLTPTPTLRSTETPTPTPLFVPSLETPEATPRRVTVTRLRDDVDPTVDRLLEKGEIVPAISLTDINGNEYVLNAQTGRTVILNFWTIGCGSCFYEFPLLQQLHDEIGDDELLIMAVNVSPLADETRLIASSMGITYPMASDPNGEVFAAYFGGAVIPTTYFISPDGTVSDAVVGPLDMEGFRSRLAALNTSAAGD